MPILLLLCCLALLAGPVCAQPVYKDLERFGTGYAPEPSPDYAPPRGSGGHGPRPGRRVDGGPGYVGSDYGLGRPAFTGLGSRPDWGRSE